MLWYHLPYKQIPQSVHLCESRRGSGFLGGEGGTEMQVVSKKSDLDLDLCVRFSPFLSRFSGTRAKVSCNQKGKGVSFFLNIFPVFPVSWWMAPRPAGTCQCEVRTKIFRVTSDLCAFLFCGILLSK